MIVSEFIEWLKTQNEDAIVKVYDSDYEGFSEFVDNGCLYWAYSIAGKEYLDLGE